MDRSRGVCFVCTGYARSACCFDFTLGYRNLGVLQIDGGGAIATLLGTKRGEGARERASRAAHALNACLLLCTAWPVSQLLVLTFVLRAQQCCRAKLSDNYYRCAHTALLSRTQPFSLIGVSRRVQVQRHLYHRRMRSTSSSTALRAP